MFFTVVSHFGSVSYGSTFNWNSWYMAAKKWNWRCRCARQSTYSSNGEVHLGDIQVTFSVYRHGSTSDSSVGVGVLNMAPVQVADSLHQMLIVRPQRRMRLTTKRRQTMITSLAIS